MHAHPEMKMLALCLLIILPAIAGSVEKKLYVVYLGEHKEEQTHDQILNFHTSHLQSVVRSEAAAAASMIYSYKKINGYAAMLSRVEAAALSGMEDVISVFPSRKHSVQTTRSWDFLKLSAALDEKRGSLPEMANYGEDVIVGVVDTGIWPESESFNDEKMGPVPVRWKGTCQEGPGFNSSHCNRKVIGARYFLSGFEAIKGEINETYDFLSTRDRLGHGTYVASILGGRAVHNVSILGGLANGTAIGGAPLARIAMYKPCWLYAVDTGDCYDADLLAAIDAAISDGVDVLSVSISGDGKIPYHKDGIAIGSLHAIKNNILTVCAAGNYGPNASSVDNTAPWLATVGATTIDRTFPSTISLGDGKIIKGESITPYALNGRFPLAYAADLVVDDLPDGYPPDLCYPNTLSLEKTEGNIVFCNRGGNFAAEKSMEVMNAGAMGCIVGNREQQGEDMALETFFLPGASVDANNSANVIGYIKSAVNSSASLIPGVTVLGNRPSPSMSWSSGRGPNYFNPYVAKPDIVAPGVNIVAAWSFASSPTWLNGDDRHVYYNIFTGTSAATAHVVAIATLLKSVHPNWTAAALKSALITTATDLDDMGQTITDHTGKRANPFVIGNGLIVPWKIADPGLVYESSYEDFILHLCSIGISMNASLKCTKQDEVYHLNYPSLAIPNIKGEVRVNRTVTNVGDDHSVYKSSIVPPAGFAVDIDPNTLSFENVGDKRSFLITVKVNDTQKTEASIPAEYAFGSYLWTDGVRIVKSPIAVSMG